MFKYFQRYRVPHKSTGLSFFRGPHYWFGFDAEPSTPLVCKSSLQGLNQHICGSMGSWPTHSNAWFRRMLTAVLTLHPFALGAALDMLCSHSRNIFASAAWGFRLGKQILGSLLEAIPSTIPFLQFCLLIYFQIHAYMCIYMNCYEYMQHRVFLFPNTSWHKLTWRPSDPVRDRLT
jgi:hypothetical protein